MTTPTVDALCLQRRQAQLYNIPPTRLELISPYGGAYSKFDLDMRRKAEVLKYANNASNSKTNNLTKRERLALIARGGPRLSPATIKANEVANCPSSASVLTPTYYSGVPGPIMLLYEDDSVPLYDYATNHDSYSQLPTIIQSTFYVVPKNDVAVANDTSGQIFAQIFTNLADFGYAPFTVNIPIGISVSGTIASLFGGATGTFTMDYIRLAQYYNGMVIQVYTYATPALYCVLDFGGNVAGGGFLASNIFIGNAVFGGISVYGAPGYVYQWYASARISYSGLATIGASTLKTAILGIGSDVVKTTSGCVIASQTSGINNSIEVTSP